jgi:hypothetical protein
MQLGSSKDRRTSRSCCISHTLALLPPLLHQPLLHTALGGRSSVLRDCCLHGFGCISCISVSVCSDLLAVTGGLLHCLSLLIPCRALLLQLLRFLEETGTEGVRTTESDG